jgi:hypothetical protein
MANAARRREAERVQEWEDQLALARQRDLLRGDAVKDAGNAVQVAEINQKIEDLKRAGAQADAVAQYEKLLRTIEADGVHARQNQANAKQAMLDQLAVDEQRLVLKQREQEALWQHELRKFEQERAAAFSTQQSQQDHEIRRMETINRMSDLAIAAVAAPSNVEAVTQIMKLQIQGGMTADQIQALSQVVAAEQGVSPVEAARMAYERVLEERAHRDAEVDKDRRHQVDLVGAARQVAPASVHVQVTAAGARRCPNGHVVPAGREHDKFCAECGAPLQ